MQTEQDNPCEEQNLTRTPQPGCVYPPRAHMPRLQEALNAIVAALPHDLAATLLASVFRVNDSRQESSELSAHARACSSLPSWLNAPYRFSGFSQLAAVKRESREPILILENALKPK